MGGAWPATPEEAAHGRLVEVVGGAEVLVAVGVKAAGPAASSLCRDPSSFPPQDSGRDLVLAATGEFAQNQGETARKISSPGRSWQRISEQRKKLVESSASLRISKD